VTPNPFDGVALGQPFPEQVHADLPDEDSGGRALAVTVAMALTAIVAGAAAVAYRRLRSPGDGSSEPPAGT